MSYEPRDFLLHILTEADYLIAQIDGLTADSFAADETLRRAFVRSLEIIGEAASGSAHSQLCPAFPSHSFVRGSAAAG